DGSKVAITVVDYSAVKAAKGTYDVTFATAKGTSITVKATVKDESITDPKNEEQISANDFAISKEEVAGLDNAKVIDLAKAEASSTVDGSKVAITVVDYSAVKAAKGTYDVTFATAKGTSITVKATVKDESITDPKNEEQISANNFVVSKEEVAGLNNAKVIDLAKAEASSTVDGSKVAITVVDYSAVKAAKGTYNVTFATAKGTSITVKATVKDESITDPKNEEQISANNFVVSKEEVAGLNNAKVIDLAKAEASSTVDGSKVAITVVDYSAVKAAKGTYNVTFATAKGTSIAVKATVKDHTEENPTNKEMISANDFAISSLEVASLTDAKVIDLAKAEASSTVDGSKVAITVVDYSAVKAAKGTYDVTFATAKGTSITVKATVKDKSITDPKNEEQISANNFVVSKEEVAGLNNAKVIDLAKAEASSTVDGSKVAITVVDYSAVKAAKGTYDVTFATAKGTSITVKATVKDHTEENPTNKEMISANDFAISKEEVVGLNSAKVIDLAKAEASSTVDGSKVAITAVDYSAIKEYEGIYSVTFATAKGTNVTVKATVYDKVVIDEDNEEGIAANDFFIDIDKVATITDADLIALANAKAWNVSDSSNVEITNVTHTLEAAKGVYDVTFATAKGTEVTVRARVVTNIIENADFVITAENFDLSKEEAQSLTDKMMIERSQVEAYRKSDFMPLQVKVDAHTIEPVKGTYDATFVTDGVTPLTRMTSNGTKITVEVRVKDVVKEDNGTGEGISANDFRISKEEATTITDEQMIKLAQARAWKLDGLADVEITKVDRGSFEAKKGVYEINFATNEGTTITVEVEVFDRVNHENGESMSGNDFVLDINDVKEFSDEELIALGNVYAWKDIDHEEVEIVKVTSTIEQAVGVYEVTYETALGTKLTLKVTVKDDNSIINEENQELIYAHDFDVNLTAVSKLSEADIIALAEAQAWDIVTGDSVTVRVKVSAIQAKAGKYEVTFTTEKGTTITVIASVKDDRKPSIAASGANTADTTNPSLYMIMILVSGCILILLRKKVQKDI
ncbi:cell division inhibitor SulA, partial [Breznakia sp. PFB2-8]|nr:cell division inhibitor SulA [Breznakia sp. PFB2-8]